MGTISSGIGLISGLDIRSIVDQLIAIDGRPRDLLTRRAGTIDAQRTALVDISARISGVLSRLATLALRRSFEASAIRSSQPDVLTATAQGRVAPGSYSFFVRQLAASHQLVSRGFASPDAPLTPGRFVLESAQARVDHATRLDELNGYAGVQPGSFLLTDGQGRQARIDLADAGTLNDVIHRVNAAGLSIRAELHGEQLVLTETSGGAIRVEELEGGHAAADLGFGPGRTSSHSGRLEGGQLIYLAGGTPLARLNDANGVRRAAAGGDFTINGLTVDLSEILRGDTRLQRLNHANGVNLGRIRVTTTTAGGPEVSQEVDLTGLSTVGQIKEAIEGAVEGVTVTLASNRLIVSATGAGQGRRLRIEDVSGTAARDLRIAGSSDAGQIDGGGVLFVDSIRDVLAAINYAAGNDGSITAAIEGDRLVIHAGGSVELAALPGSGALEDLGFAAGTFGGSATGRRLLGGINTVLLSTLNGGRGFELGQIRIQAAGSDVTLDLRGAETLRDVIELLNEASAAEGLEIEAGYDPSGTRLTVRSLDGVSPVAITDVSGTFAQTSGIAGSGASLRGVNLQRQYLSETTALSSLNNGAGVAPGRVRITNGDGAVRTVTLSASDTTLADVLDRINAAGAEIGVRARINDTGDGLLIEDASGGPFALKIEDESGTAARDLRIAGQSAAGRIDGSFELRIDLSANATLAELVTQINAAGGPARATLLNDGSGVSPYRIQLSAATTGLAGEIIADGLDLGLEFSTLSRAQDAQVVVGPDASSGVLATSSSNTLTDVVPGLTINLSATSVQPITVTIERDVESVVTAIRELVDGLNAALGRIAEVSEFDPETQQRGVLLGDGTVRLVESRLLRAFTGRIPGATGALQRLADVGIRLREGELQLDEETLRAKLTAEPDEVMEFFADPETGAAPYLQEQLKQLSDAGGLIDRRNDTLDRQRDDLNRRIEQLNTLLDRRRTQLSNRFLAMERALAELQAQQASLGQLASLSGGLSIPTAGAGR